MKQWRIEVVGSKFVIATAYVLAPDREKATAIAYQNFGILVGSIHRVPFFQEKRDEAQPTNQG